MGTNIFDIGQQEANVTTVASLAEINKKLDRLMLEQKLNTQKQGIQFEQIIMRFTAAMTKVDGWIDMRTDEIDI